MSTAPPPATLPLAIPRTDAQSIRSKLLRWYRAVARDLPWRREPSPYRVWLSEMMLQQTRVDTVIPYFERFLAAFPDVRRLAAADEHDVLRLWAGLGYYARARNLHSAARVLSQRGFPTSVAGWRALPGVGPYAAGAIASIANGVCAAAVDGNVKRVLSRLFLVAGDRGPAATSARIWSLAEQLVPRRAAGDFNQALMELGARLCTPRNPRCSDCPLASRCRAARSGCAADYPVRTARRAPAVVRALGMAVTRNGAILLERRKPGGLLGGLWGLPADELGAHDSATHALARLRKHIEGAARVCAGDHRPCGEVRHVFTHRKLQLSLFSAPFTRRAGKASLKEWMWITPQTRDLFALSTLDRRALSLLWGEEIHRRNRRAERNNLITGRDA